MNINHLDLFQDSEGRSPIHIAITSKHPIVTRLLLSHPELDMNVTDRSGQTPFAVALRTRDHDAAKAILAREPGAAEQVMSKLLQKAFSEADNNKNKIIMWSEVGEGWGGEKIVIAGVFVLLSFCFPAFWDSISDWLSLGFEFLRASKQPMKDKTQISRNTSSVLSDLRPHS